MGTKTHVTIRVPRVPGVLLGVFLSLAIVGGFMAIDRTVGHWYTQDPQRLDVAESTLGDIERDVAGLQRDIESVRQNIRPTVQAPAYTGTRTRWVYVLKEDAENAKNYPGEGPPPCSDFSAFSSRTAYPESKPFTQFGYTYVPVECKY